MQNQARLPLSDIAKVIRVATYHCLFDPVVEVQLIATINEQWFSATVHGEASLAVATLEAFSLYDADSVIVKDVSHQQDILRLGTINEDYVEAFPCLFNVVTLGWQRAIEDCNNVTESFDASALLSTMLKEKFG